MPAGYAITLGMCVAGLLLSVAPLGRRGWRGVLSWFISAIPNESPFLAVYWVAASTLLASSAGDIREPACARAVHRRRT